MGTRNGVIERIDYLVVSSKRECCFYILYLKDEIEGAKIHDLSKFESIIDCEKRINGELLRLSKSDHKKLMSLIAEMQKAFGGVQPSKEEFKWLNERDNRFGNWVWCFLRDNVERPNSELLSLLSYNPLKNNRSNIDDRRLDVILSFVEGEADVGEQLECADYITEQWIRNYKNKELIDWLDNANKIQWKWAWGYLEKKEPRAVRKAWSPVSEIECREALVAAIDMFDDTYRKKLFLMNMKKAWSQKKFRDKSGGKKAYSINMTPKTKERLDELAEHYELKLNEVIEKLVKEEHNIVNS